MNAREPRKYAHRGWVEAAGFLFLGADARARVLAAWRPGATVLAWADGYVLVGKPRRVRAETAPGVPLVMTKHVLASAPLQDDELEGVPAGAIANVHHGALQLHARPAPEEPSTWLDLSAFAVAEVRSLGEGPARLAIPLPPKQVAARELVRSTVGAPPAERASLLGAMRGDAPRSAAPGKAAWWLRALARIAAFFAQSARTGPAVPAKPGFFDRALGWLSKLAARSQLARYFGRKHAEYLARLFQMFESGDLDAALRHAIPLGGAAGSDSQPALLPPRARESLKIGPAAHGGGRSIGLGGDLYSELRARYRAAIDRLVRAGRIEDAAFVHVELLQQPADAVALLEKHGKLRLAAEVAEGRGLPPGLVVRQWFLAGDRVRAVEIARKTGAFADAIARLERDRKDEAWSLRLHWADALAASGDYVNAVSVLWTPPEGLDARGLQLAWIERGLAVGGIVEARLLPRWLVLNPSSFPQVRERALRLLDAKDSDVRAREAFAEGLQAVHPNATGAAREAVEALIRPTVRALVRDGRRRDVVEKLVASSGDHLLRADLPAMTKDRAERATGGVVELVFDAADVGTRPAYDAAVLPDGKLLVALGEGGAALHSRDGRRIASFDRPAFGFVVSDHGDRAIAVAPRGSRLLLSRIDLVSRRAEPWCDLAISGVTRTYDGSVLHASTGNRVLALDMLEAEPRVQWSVDVEGRAAMLGRNAKWLQIAVWNGSSEGWSFERWAYELPAHTMRERREVFSSHLSANPGGFSLSSDGVLAIVAPLEASGSVVRGLHVCAPGGRPEALPLEGPLQDVVVEGAFVACVQVTPAGTLVSLRHRPTLEEKARIVLGGARRAQVWLDDVHLTLADDRGRVLVFDLARRALVRDLRT